MAALQRLRKRHIEALLGWYDENQRDFPWRKNPDPYWVWLAEIMSQQTVMAALLPYFYRFIEKFPDVESLACASEDDVLAAWTGLGYYSRARNIHKAAKKIAQELGGEFPRTLEGWLELSGVGPYTAAAVVSQCFGVEEPVWDGNVTRVTSRLDARSDVWTSRYRTEMEAALRQVMRGHDPSRFNQALMELGATVCTPKAFACGRCPVQDACAAYAKKSVATFPPPKLRKENVELKCAVSVRLRKASQGGTEAWLERRGESDWFAGLWDFPSTLGGATRPTTPRKIAGKPFGEVRHQITHHKIFLSGHVEFNKRAPNKTGRWVSLDELVAENPPVPLSTTARKILRLLMSQRAC